MDRGRETLTGGTLFRCPPVGSYLLTLLSSFDFSIGWWTFDCLLHIREMCRFRTGTLTQYIKCVVMLLFSSQTGTSKQQQTQTNTTIYQDGRFNSLIRLRPHL